MICCTHLFHRAATARELRSHLRCLRSVCRAARQEVRRRRTQSSETQRDAAAAAGLSSSALAGAHMDLLPRNSALESAVALAISENRDARTELEFTRHFLRSTLLSLAAPVGPWDPYDTKPQVFALDTYIALPVFTSLDYLRLFCRRFRFTVRDPSGALWADGPADDDCDHSAPPAALPDVSGSAWWARHARRHALTAAAEALRPSGEAEALRPSGEAEALRPSGEAEALRPSEEAEALRPSGEAEALRPSEEAEALRPSEEAEALDLAPWLDADALFDEISTQTTAREPINGEKAKRRKRKKRRVSHESAGDSEPGTDSGRDTAAREAFWAKVRATAPFGITRATPLHAFGPPLQPFFVGYFADVHTLLHNASIVPEKVDIVLNPCSPIEFVLAREATDRVLHGDQLLSIAYLRVERELRGEFHRFFHHCCPEVVSAHSACVPCPVPGAAGAVRYEIAVLLQSENPTRTFACLRAAKKQCALMGHADLDVMPWDLAAPYVREAATLFYERAGKERRNGAAAQLGAFERRGPVQTINMARPAESYYHDPSAVYTESHAVFTEELKIRRHVK